jgi:hypothetical protein
MINYPPPELPIRSKVAMARDVAQVIHSLGHGERRRIEILLHDLLVRSLDFNPEVQHRVLEFAGQVLFQYDYDPWHTVSKEVAAAADRLMESLGFFSYSSITDSA